MNVLQHLHQLAPNHVYRMLVAYQRVHRKQDDKWAARSFREIYRRAPPERCSMDFLPDFYPIEEWIAFGKWRP